MSYSHDDDEHRDWVLALASRLRSNGVDVCLDRWDVTLGGNLAFFMERAANVSYRVIAVVSEAYTRKADERVGGAGVEAQMLSSRLYSELKSDQVIPIVRKNAGNPPSLPAFLSGRLWLDFRDESSAEKSYETLLRDIHGVAIDVAPPLGPNPFEGKSDIEAMLEIRNSPSRWHSPGLSGDIEFVYSQNSGKYLIGAGPCQFTLEFGERGPDVVYVYRDSSDIKHIAVIAGVREREALLADVSQFETSSRVVAAGAGDAVVLHNQNGFWALIFITSIYQREALDIERVIHFHYVVQSNRTSDFSEIVTIS